MKIAYLLASSGLSGGAKVVFQQAEELARRGHEVTVVSPEPPPGWFALSACGFEQSSAPASRALAESDAVIATFWTTIDPAVRAARGTVFHLCQGLESDTAFYADRREAIRAAYRLVPRKLVVSPHVGEFLRTLGFTDVVDVGQCFDAGAFRVADRVFDGEDPWILLPGLYEIDVKGVGEGLEALALLRRRGARFRVARVSPERVCGEERQRGIVDEYHRCLPPDRMPALLARSDVFLGPNHAVEGFGLPSLEALAAGVPAALSDTPSHRAMAGGDAVFFPAGDVEAMAAALARLIEEPETRRRLSAAGPLRAGRYRTSDVADRLEAVFEAARRA